LVDGRPSSRWKEGKARRDEMKKEEQQFSDNDLNDQLPSLGKDMGVQARIWEVWILDTHRSDPPSLASSREDR
jgi:hypothetical protein